MSNLYKSVLSQAEGRVAAIAGATRNELQRYCHKPFSFLFTGKATRFIGTLLLVLSAMIAPAQAGYEYVDPLPGIVWYPLSIYGSSGTYTSGVDACNFIEQIGQLNSTYVTARFAGITGPVFRNQTGALGMFLCNWDMNLTNFVWGPLLYRLDRPIYSARVQV